MSEHVLSMENDDEGWEHGRCSCGVEMLAPDAEDIADWYGDHRAFVAQLSIVYVVRDEVGREDIQGVYSSPEAAMAAHPAEWELEGGSWLVDGGESLWIQEWVVDGGGA